MIQTFSTSFPRAIPALAIFAALSSVHAFAGDAVVPEYVVGGQSPDHRSVYWNQHSRDGYLSREDAIRYGARDFTKIDSDSDGRVSLVEWNAWHAQAPRSQPNLSSSEWKRFDRNRDGFISKREAKDMDSHTWTYADLNADGRISDKEWQAVSSIANKTAGADSYRARSGRTGWEEMDRDQDGWITRGEARELDAHTFARLDVDGDGRLSEKEWGFTGSLGTPGAAGRTAPAPPFSR
jgi:hypothetical protein